MPDEAVWTMHALDRYRTMRDAAPAGGVLGALATYLTNAEGMLSLGLTWMRGVDAGLRLALAEPERCRALLAAMDAEVAAADIQGAHDCAEDDVRDLTVFRALLDAYAEAVPHA